jgi:hypothetical protein
MKWRRFTVTIAKATPQGTLSYTYDPVGVSSMSPNKAKGISAAYTYDNLNRLSRVVDNRLTVGRTLRLQAKIRLLRVHAGKHAGRTWASD